MPNLTFPVDIGIVAYPGALMSAVHGLTDMFSVSNLQVDEIEPEGKTRIRTSHWTLGSNGEVIHSGPGPDADFGKLKAIVIPPTLGELPVGPRMGDLPKWLRGRHAEGTIVASVCGGAYLLCETGLASGRTITTHWQHGDLIRDRHPDVKVDVDRLLIDEGDIMTAGGMMAWLDLGLNLVDRFLGSSVMLATSRFMLVDPGAREQRFYAGFNPRLDHGDTVILELQHWLHGADIRGLTLQAMAQRARLTARTFLRRFHNATGLNPTEYCQRLKMAKSREMLVRPGMTLDQIARNSGYEDPQAYRKVFRKVFGISPSEYRMRYSPGRIDAR